MSIRYNNVKLASANTYHPDLFDVKWSDHTLDNISWLRADTFSWHSGALYTRAYQHLVSDLQHDAGHDTINGIDIYYHLAPDGHKIVGPDHEDVIQQLYESTGVAWYYIVDEVNKRFKLPRTKYAFTGVRNNVGKFVEAGLPNIIGSLQSRGYGDNTYYGAITEGDEAFEVQKGSSTITSLYSGTVHASGDSKPDLIQFDASKSNEIYGNSDTVQPQATEMYLYFYVGNFAQKDITTTYGPEFMAHQPMPSDRYIDLTLGASGSTCTAPADGYFVFSGLLSDQGYIALFNLTAAGMNSVETSSGIQFPHIFLPTSKGDIVKYTYYLLSDDTSKHKLSFIYANGAK